MNSILVVGAGKEGKGFWETPSTDGWKVSFLDKDPKVIEALKKGSYTVHSIRSMAPLLGSSGIMMPICVTRLIPAWMPFGCRHHRTCTVPRGYPEAADYLGRGLSKGREGREKFDDHQCHQ